MYVEVFSSWELSYNMALSLRFLVLRNASIVSNSLSISFPFAFCTPYLTNSTVFLP